jgi:type IV secretion system protein VirD4
LEQTKRLAALLLALSFLIVNWMTTQHAAFLMGYSKQLGPTMFRPPWLGPIYWPWKWIDWAWRFWSLESLRPLWIQSLHEVVYPMVPVAGLVVIGTAVARQGWLRSQSADLHGSARWAGTPDVRRAGLLPTNNWIGRRWRSLATRLGLSTTQTLMPGIFLAAWPNKRRQWFLRDCGPSHVLVFAPTRSGKGAGVVVPTLLSWPHSVIVHDLKGENWATTAGWRKRSIQICLKFDPTDTTGCSVKYNPLEEVRIRTHHEAEDVQNIVHMIVDPHGHGLHDHWVKTGAALLTGTILHVLYAEPTKTLRGVAGLLSDPDAAMEETINRILATKHDPEGKMGWRDYRGRSTQTHPIVAESMRELLNKSENERSGVFSTAMSFLSLYRDPVVAANTERSEFHVNDLMNHERPVSLYLVVPLASRDRLRPLIRLIINQIVRTLTASMNYRNGRAIPNYVHPLLLMLDEFPTLGRLEVFAEALSLIAGYGLRACLIAQDLSQIHAAYGHDESITSNCNTRVAFAPNRIETARWISAMAGNTTVRHSHRTLSNGGASISEPEIARPLITPDEVMRMSNDNALIFTSGHPTIRARKLFYFKQPRFAARAAIPPPGQSDRVVEPSASASAAASSQQDISLAEKTSNLSGDASQARKENHIEHHHQIGFLKPTKSAKNGPEGLM